MSIEDNKPKDLGIDPDNFNFDDILLHYKDDMPQGWQIVLRLYIPPSPPSKSGERKIGSVILPNSMAHKVRMDEKFGSMVGLVVKMADGVYKDERYKLTGPYCKPGDWVMVPRAHGHSYDYNGYTSLTINEDAILKVVGNPTSISKIKVED